MYDTVNVIRFRKTFAMLFRQHCVNSTRQLLQKRIRNHLGRKPSTRWLPGWMILSRTTSRVQTGWNDLLMA